MVHRIVFILLLLLLVFSLTAQQGELSAEEYQRRNVELQRLANRFKQETGFEGSIDIDHQNMTLSHFRGRFRDVVFPSQSDTMSVKQVGDIIIERLLPVLPAPKEQLSIERIGSWGKELIIQYQQTINGYQIEGAGFLRIFHDYNRDRTTILNVLVSIDPTPVTPRITEEEALNYFYSQIVISDNKKDLPYYKPITKLLYCPVIDQNTGSPALPHQYLLSWRIDIGGHRLVINAITGEKMYYTTTVRRDHVVNVRGTIYPNSDESVNLTPFTQDFDNAMVEIIDSLGTSIHWTQNGILNYSGTNVQEIKSYLIGGHYEITNAIGQNIILSQAIADPNSSLTNFEHIPNPSNLFFYSNDFISFLNAFLGSNGYPVYLPFLMIQADYPFVSADTLGTFNASSNIIRIHTDAGQFRSTLSHEIMHAYVYTSLNYDFFNGIIPYCDTRDAMDEAFSMYYPCAYRDSPIYRHTAVIFEGLHSQTYVYPTPGHVMTEDCYSRYENRIPIASAWWELRSHFADFDQLLITTLGRVSTAHPDRYKPRYFFNLLMREVATDTLSWTINSDQQRIIDAYKDRGLHFYPSVITTGPDNGYRSATVKNIFDLGDPVYVSLTDFPQNTEVKIYLVKNQEYTDGMNIPAGFTDEVIETLIVMTDNEGKWQSPNPLWTPIDMNDAGEYDIIVDVENNGHLNFAFNGSNVRDGIKGLNEPGFIVEDRGIDVVISVDISGSMYENESNLKRTVNTIVGNLENKDRVNVFGHGHWFYLLNYIGGWGSPNLNGPFYGDFEIVDGNYAGFFNTIDTELIVLPPDELVFTCLHIPFLYGKRRFEINEENNRSKALIILSDGTHNDQATGYGNNSFNSLIFNHFVSDEIKVYAMRFSPSTNAGIQRMRNFARWGNGEYYAHSVFSSHLSITRMLRSIRGESSTTERIVNLGPSQEYVETFPVDVNAHSLQVTLSWPYNLQNPQGTELLIISPSDIEYGYNTNNCNYQLWGFMGKIGLDYPESGQWRVEFQNPTQTPINLSLDIGVSSDISIKVQEIPFDHPSDTPLPISVVVKDYLTPIQDAIVHLDITRPNNEVSTLYLHNTQEDNGTYTNYYHPLGLEGEHKFLLQVLIPSRSAQRMKNFTVNMESSNSPYPEITRKLHEGWNWVGFPRLVQEDYGSEIPYATSSLYPYLRTVKGLEGDALFDGDQWIYRGLDRLNSISGYSLLIQDIAEVELLEMGSLVDTTAVYPLMKNQLSFITYPCYNNSYALDAFENVLDKIDTIMAEKWCLYKENGVWKTGYATRPILRYGDAVYVNATEDAELVWNTSQLSPLWIEPEKPEFFLFQDKAVYETIMIEEIEEDPEYLEIGVFQNGECIGGKVFDGYPLQLLAYSEEMRDESGLLEFRIYCGEERNALELETVKIQAGSVVMPYTEMYASPMNIRTVTLKLKDSIIPKSLELYSNYPNPFNPSTTINFEIPRGGNVNIAVFNIKGQQVDIILDEFVEAGKHSVVWNGTNFVGRRVSSGIYFTRLKSGKETRFLKMLLLK